MTAKVVVLDDYQRCARTYADWDVLGGTVDFVHEHLEGADLTARLAGTQVVVAMRERTPFPAAVLAALPDLELLVTTGGSNASIDLEAAARQGVTVCGTRGLDGPAAEMTWALILATARQVPYSDRLLRDGRWQETVGQDLAGKRLGLVGLGRLGQRVARVGLAFEMNVCAWSQNLDPELARRLGVDPVSKNELFAESDIVSLHVRLSDRTRGLVGRAELDSMRPGSILVNTSRGGLVEEDALLRALDDGPLGAAGLDVFTEEPLPVTHPLRSRPDVVITPHLGYVTLGSYATFFADAVEDIAAWRAGDPLRVLAAAE